MALFVFAYLLMNNCFTTLLGFESRNSSLLEIKPSTTTAGQNVGFYKVDDTLNLTCTFKNESNLHGVVLEWVVPSKASNSQNRFINIPGTSFVMLTIENLQESDSGEYKCKAVHNGVPFFNQESFVRISVKNKKKECSDVMFQCSAGICIQKRYTCDGLKDCPHGEDESSSYCGPGNPCDNKLMCPENRCIPFSWCCESNKEPNCTTKIKHRCCTYVEKLTRDDDDDFGYQYEQQRFSDVGFLQTTVYTVIGCAVAFTFIVMIIVVAICRVHVRRPLLPRCPAANRNVMLGEGGNVHENHLDDSPSFYDYDLYFNRPSLDGNDPMAVNPLLVTYNISNGVEFVGRPIDPPPYCEIAMSPPKEGPPPPYSSQENLCDPRRSTKLQELSEEERSETDATESDSLLAAAVPNVSVISSNAIGASPPAEITSARNSRSPPETNKIFIDIYKSVSKEGSGRR